MRVNGWHQPAERHQVPRELKNGEPTDQAANQGGRKMPPRRPGERGLNHARNSSRKPAHRSGTLARDALERVRSGERSRATKRGQRPGAADCIPLNGPWQPTLGTNTRGRQSTKRQQARDGDEEHGARASKHRNTRDDGTGSVRAVYAQVRRSEPAAVERNGDKDRERRRRRRQIETKRGGRRRTIEQHEGASTDRSETLAQDSGSGTITWRSTARRAAGTHRSGPAEDVHTKDRPTASTRPDCEAREGRQEPTRRAGHRKESTPARRTERKEPEGDVHP